MASKNGLTLLRYVIEECTMNHKGFENVLHKIKPISSGQGKCICEMKVDENHQNRLGTLHGGMTATLVDAISTWALLTSEEGVPGVSVDLSVTYMKGAKVGDEIVIDAVTLKRGKTLAFLTVDIRNKLDGSLLAQGKHTKFVG